MNFAPTPAVPSLEASSSPPLNHAHDDRPSCSSFSSTSSPSFVRSLWRRLNWNPGPSSISGCSPLSRGSSKIFCRICHDYEEDGVVGTLISPCKCSGTSGMIHQHCLEKWLSTSNHDSCEICGFQFQLRKRPKTLGEWLCSRPFSSDHRNLAGDIACFVLLTPMAAVSCYLCIIGALHYIEVEDLAGSLGLSFLSGLVVMIYLIWFVLTAKYHWEVFGDWRKRNHSIRLDPIRDSSSVLSP